MFKLARSCIREKKYLVRWLWQHYLLARFQVVKKSTVEEALSTRSQFDRMKNKDTLEKVHREEVDRGEVVHDLDEKEGNEVSSSDRMLPSSMINMNFEYQLVSRKTLEYQYTRLFRQRTTIRALHYSAKDWRPWIFPLPSAKPWNRSGP